VAQQLKDDERERLEAERLAEEVHLRRQQAKMKERRLAQEAQQRASAEKRRRGEEEQQKQRALELEQQQLQRAQEEAELHARHERMRQLEIERKETERKAAEEEERRRRIEIELQEAERMKAEEARKQKIEWERQEAERKRMKEEQRRQEAELEERRRVEQEAREKKLARLEEERKKRELQERKETVEWNERIRQATTILLWRRLKRRLPRHLQVMSEAQTSIRRLGSPAPESFQMVLDRAVDRRVSSMASPPAHCDPPRPASTRIVIDRLLRQEHKRTSLASMLLPTISRLMPRSQSLDDEKSSFLFKIAIILPETDNTHDQSLCALIRAWIAGRLGGFDHVDIAASNRCRVGVVIVDGTTPDRRDACDASLVVVPLSLDHGIDESIHSLMHILDDDTPRVFLALSQRFGADLEQAGQDIEDALSGSFDDVAVLSNSELSEKAMEESLRTASEAVLSALVTTRPKVIDQLPMDQLCLMCISEAMWQQDRIDRRDDLVTLAKESLNCLVEQLDAMRTMAERKWGWPPPEFADATGSFVKDYFGDSIHLPMDWTSSMLRRNVEPSVAQLQNRIDGTLPDAIRNLLTGAPRGVQEECRLLLDNRCFRRCLQRALMWKSENQEPWQSESYVYIPQTLVRGIVQKTAAAMKAAAVPTTTLRSPFSHVGKIWDEGNSFGSVDANFLETIDLPPTDSPPMRSHAAVQEAANMSESRNILSAKRSRVATEQGTAELSSRPWAANNISAASKKVVHNDDDTNNKRRRHTPPNSHSKRRSTTGRSRELDESMSFTKRLQAMVAGDVLHDRMIGSQSLSVLLRKSDIMFPDTKT
jgi:hypothetical protein